MNINTESSILVNKYLSTDHELCIVIGQKKSKNNMPFVSSRCLQCSSRKYMQKYFKKQNAITFINVAFLMDHK